MSYYVDKVHYPRGSCIKFGFFNKPFIGYSSMYLHESDSSMYSHESGRLKVVELIEDENGTIIEAWLDYVR